MALFIMRLMRVFEMFDICRAGHGMLAALFP